MLDWLPVATAVGLVSALLGIGIWIGGVNSDRENFKEFIREVREDIKKILRRLPPRTIEGASPLRLTELGRAISKELDAGKWAREVAPSVQCDADDAFGIQQLSFEYAKQEDSFSPAMVRAIRKSAFEHGIEEEQVRQVLALELRDVLLQQEDLEAP